MKYENYISEQEAAHRAGVSITTLKRFSDAGYIQTEADKDGSTRFHVRELEKVFGLPASELEIVKDINLASQTTYSTSIDPIAIDIEAPLPTPAQTPVEAAPIQQSRDTEIIRMQHLIDLQDRFIEAKEQEIKSLKEERDWLRNRIEKLEEKNDRDQLILVSVSETNRGLLRAIENKPSLVKGALEWLGLLPPPPPTTNNRT